MSTDYWNTRFHLQPRDGWMNDPNGLCQMGGTYYLYYQYAPGWPADDLKYWGLATSTDLLSWSDQGAPLAPDSAADRDGVFSGSAWIERSADGTSLMRVLYTGNVIDHSVAVRVDEGRESNQIMVTSEDGKGFSAKQVVLTAADYPASCTLHVRDPKVWEEDGVLHMLLGARERGSMSTADPNAREDVGIVLVYDSTDRGQTWKLHAAIRPVDSVGETARLGYMWECPNLVQVDGRSFLAVCPQGLPEEELRWQNLWQAGYLPLREGERVLDAATVDASRFAEWDHGFDFYAPQVFDDEKGRTILIGWMGTFDSRYTSTPKGMDRAHCMTLPRELSVGPDGLLRQLPVAELLARRGAAATLAAGEPLTLEGLHADVVLEGVRGEGELWLNDVLCVFINEGTMGVRFAASEAGIAAAAGRTERRIATDGVHDLRIVVDGSTVEVYANGGAEVFSTRWFPAENSLVMRSNLAAASAQAWRLS